LNMLTAIVVVACIFAFLWGANILAGGFTNNYTAFWAMTLSPIVGLGTLLASCWEAALGLAILLVFGGVMVVVVSAMCKGGGGLLKLALVIGACIIALPPFWPIAIPLALCLVCANILLAPFALLAGSIKGFLGGS